MAEAFITDGRPCPWCGAKPEAQPWHGGGPEKHLVSCSNLGCLVAPATTGETLEEALRIWNSYNPTPGCATKRSNDERASMEIIETNG